MDAALAVLLKYLGRWLGRDPAELAAEWLAPGIALNWEQPALATVAELIPQGDRAGGPLRSVFDDLNRDTPSDAPHYWPFAQLSLDESALFPIKVAPAAEAERQLQAQFSEEAARLQAISDLPTVIASLLSLMQRYTWCVSAGDTADAADAVSLYDRARTSAALAAALSKHGGEGKSVALMVEGDISGIQRFIYTVAAKTLRARSLYLQLLTEAAARLLLREHDMPLTNLIYAGGGRFYLVLPAGANLDGVRQKLDAMLLEHHDGSLYLALGQAELRPEHFKSGGFAEVWRQVGQSTGDDKRRRFAYMKPKDMLDVVFEPRQLAGELLLRYEDRDDPVDAVSDKAASAFSKSLVDLGTDLRRAEHIVLVEIEPQATPRGSFQAALAQLGMGVLLLDGNGRLTRSQQRQSSRPIRAQIQGMRQAPEDALLTYATRELECPVAGALRFTVNVVPSKHIDGKTEPATFNDLQQASQGLKRMAVLRMDVDDLGKLFAKGFQRPGGGSRASLARVASLSFALSLYFEGWVGELCRKISTNHRRDNVPDTNDGRLGGYANDVETVYTVYSGGDDLFLVASWDVAPTLAQRIQADFSHFACGNPNVHISAGITLHGGKYPLYQAADDAEGALDDAKDVDGKDAISFLGQTVRWRDWQRVLALRDNLTVLSASDGAKRALLQTIIRFHADYETTRQQQSTNHAGQRQFAWGAWLWRSAYQFARLKQRTPDHKVAIDNLHKNMIAYGENDSGQPYVGIVYAGLAARWVEAETRKARDKQTMYEE